MLSDQLCVPKNVSARPRSVHAKVTSPLQTHPGRAFLEPAPSPQCRTLLGLHVGSLPPLLLWLSRAWRCLPILYFVSTTVLNLHLHSQQRESVELTSPCAWWVTCNEVHSLRKCIGPSGIRSRAKAPPETTWMMGFYRRAFVPPPPRRSLVEDSTVRLSPAGVASGPPPTPAHSVAGTTPVGLHRLFLHIS